MDNSIGYTIKTFREKHHLSQQDLAKRLGVSQRNVSYYESGERIPPADVLKKIAVLFKVSADDLLGIPDLSISNSDLEWRYPPVKNRLGVLLTKYIDQQKLTRKQFAEILNISLELLDNILLGIYVPNMELFSRMANVMSCDVNYLTGATDFASFHSPDGNQQLEADWHFKARLQALCIMHDVTYDNVEATLGITQTEFSDIRDNRMPTLEELLKISYGFQVSMDYLIGKTDISIPYMTQDELALVLNYRGCLPQYKKYLSDKAERLSIESIDSSSGGDVAASPKSPKTGTDSLK